MTRVLFRLSWATSLLLTIFALASPGHAQHIAKSDWLSPADEQTKLKVPPGFELQLFASEPQIHKPLNMVFDREGRLWVTDTVEYPNPVGNEERGRDTVKVLVDTDGDGHADQVTTFADGLNIPIGLYPIDHGVIVFSIPNIWRCVDTNGDGKADTKEKMFGPFGRDDTHGLTNSFTRGLDGWLYATHGYSNTSTIEGTDKQPITMQSGNTYRMRLDGSHVEYFCHGQVNPFGLAFDPLGNLYSADCHTMPLYQLLRGAYYPSFGKADDGLGFGPKMVNHDHGSTAIGGIVYYAAEQFPPEYRDNIFVGNPVTCRVNRDRMDQRGATYDGIEKPDLVVSDDPWFRPVNMTLGPDGAVYIADFYNRIIGHYEVPLDHPGRDRESGRIWRLVYTGKGVKDATPKTPPAPTKVSDATPERLVELLGDPNLTVRTLATHELADRVGPGATPLLTVLLAAKEAKPFARAHALWALERISPVDDQTIGRLAGDSDRAVRVHVMKLLSERPNWPNPATTELARKALSDADPWVRRAAADALARHPQAENLSPIMALWSTTPKEDTHLTHTARMALRDQLAAGFYPQAITLAKDQPERRAQLADVSLGVPNAEAAAFLFDELKSDTPGPRDLFLRHAIRHIADDRLPEVYHYAINLKQGDLTEQGAIAKAIAQALCERGSAVPQDITDWSTELMKQLLTSDKELLVRSGIELSDDFHAPGAFDFLAKAAVRKARFGKLRQAAIDACVSNDTEKATPLFGTIIADSEEPMKMRVFAATALGRLNNDAARETLGKQLPNAPDQLAGTIAAGLASSTAGAEILLTTISAGKASPRLLQGGSVSWRLRSRKVPEITERLEKLTAGLPPEDAQIAKLIKQRRGVVSKLHGDVAGGGKVFTKTCAACHRIGEEGGKVGPNLDGIGMRGVDRLLEDVLDPNRNVDQSFRTTQIFTKDGEIITGLALREEGQVIVLADPQGKEVRVSKDDIDERTVSSLSLMPTNIAEQLPEKEFADLMAYLLAQRQAKK